MSDQDKDKTETKAEPKSELPKNIPVVPPPPPVGGVELEDYKGEYTRISDGEIYALAVDVADPLGRTHKARNSVHFWEGTMEQFKKEFYKKGDKAPATADEAEKAKYEAAEKARTEREKELAAFAKK